MEGEDRLGEDDVAVSSNPMSNHRYLRISMVKLRINYGSPHTHTHPHTAEDARHTHRVHVDQPAQSRSG